MFKQKSFGCGILGLILAGFLHSAYLSATDFTQGGILRDGSNNQKVTLGTTLACERNPSSATNGYCVTRDEHTGTVVSAGTGVKTISSAPAHLGSVIINAALVGTLTITCMNDEAGTAANYVLPAALAANAYDFEDVKCDTSLSVQKSSASDDGKITISWRPQ